jgi:hypothetical protein
MLKNFFFFVTDAATTEINRLPIASVFALSYICVKV